MRHHYFFEAALYETRIEITVITSWVSNHWIYFGGLVYGSLDSPQKIAGKPELNANTAWIFASGKKGDR